MYPAGGVGNGERQTGGRDGDTEAVNHQAAQVQDMTTKGQAPQPNDGLAKIGNSFANLFRRQHAQALQIEAMQAEIDDTTTQLLAALEEQAQKLDDLMTQLIAAADEETDDE